MFIINKYLKNYFDEFKKMEVNRTVIVCAVLISLLFSCPLILNNHLYVDDLIRNIEGFGWNHDGRYLTTTLMKVLSTNKKVISIYPYSVTLSCLILFFSAYIITSGATKFSLKTNLLISSTVFSSPFILENLSYRYDCLPMSLAVLSCTVPFVFVENIKKFSAFSIICLMFTCLTYQPALSIYPICTFIICASIAKNNLKYAIKIALKSFILFLIPCVIYILLMKVIGASPWYAKYNESNSIVSLDVNRFFDVYRYISNSLNSTQKTIILAAIFFSLIITIFRLIKLKSMSDAFILLLILFAFPLSISMLLISSNMPIVARFFMGFSFLFCLFFSIPEINCEKIIAILSALLIVVTFSMISAYSCALDEQYNFEKNQMLMAFSNVNTANENRIITVIGSLPHTDSVKLRANIFPIIEKITPIYMQERWQFGKAFLKNLSVIKNYDQYISGNLKEQKAELSDKIKLSKCDMKLTKESLYFNLYESGEAVLIDFKKEPCDVLN